MKNMLKLSQIGHCFKVLKKRGTKTNKKSNEKRNEIMILVIFGYIKEYGIIYNSLFLWSLIMRKKEMILLK